MIPDGMLKSALFGGFEKTSVEDYLQKQLDILNQLELQAGLPLTQLQPALLQKTRIGSGYDKQSVLEYITALQQNIITLEEKLKKEE